MPAAIVPDSVPRAGYHGAMHGITHPGLQPYRALLTVIAGTGSGARGGSAAITPRAIDQSREAPLLPPDWIARADALAAASRLATAGGARLRFVPAAVAPPGDALAYEARIHDRGEVACRTTGRGALHDLHNAVVWLRFPRTKAWLNRGHVAAGAAGAAGAEAHRRRPLRDALTLVDENGVVWFGDGGELDAALADRDWSGLFVRGRAALAASVRVIVVGHGLLEKLHRPYKAMTAHAVVVAPWPAGRPFDDDPLRPHPADAALAETLAARQSMLADASRRPSLLPLPIQGLPDWDPANRDPSYYADPGVFRPAPSAPPARSAATTRGDPPCCSAASPTTSPALPTSRTR